MSWRIPMKYGYGSGGEDYLEFVWHFGRCHTTRFRQLRAARRAREAKEAARA